MPEIITLPDHLLPAEGRTSTPTQFGEVKSYAPRKADFEVALTPEQTAAKLAQKNQNEQVMQAAADSILKPSVEEAREAVADALSADAHDTSENA